MQRVIPGMQKKGAGWIVNLSSGVARHAYGTPVLEGPSSGPFGASQGVYGATKAALNRITVAFATELWGTGIRVNTVEPSGLVLSEGAVARGVDGIPESAIQPMDQMVDSVVFLCSCPEERTGGVYSSKALLEEISRSV